MGETRYFEFESIEEHEEDSFKEEEDSFEEDEEEDIFGISSEDYLEWLYRD